MAVLRPDLMMKCVVPVIMAGESFLSRFLARVFGAVMLMFAFPCLSSQVSLCVLARMDRLCSRSLDSSRPFVYTGHLRSRRLRPYLGKQCVRDTRFSFALVHH